MSTATLAGRRLPADRLRPVVLNVVSIIAFLAGFSERFTGVMFGNAERLLTGEGDQQPPTAAAVK